MFIEIHDAITLVEVQDDGITVDVIYQNIIVEVIEGGAIAVPGPQGEEGPEGPGLPVGGATGAIPRKASNTDFDTEWFTPGTMINKNFWQGSQAEYDAIVTPDPETVYFIV